MLGFSDRSLILCPDPNSFENRPHDYKIRMERTLKNIIKYCDSYNIQSYILETDEVAMELISYMCKPYATLSPGDKYFMRKHNPVLDKYARDVDKSYEANWKKAVERFAFPEGKMTVEQRFGIITKREARVAREIIANNKLIFNIQEKNKKQYKAVTKEGDGRIVISIDAYTFTATAELSGTVTPVIDILDLGCANLPVFNWEV